MKKLIPIVLALGAVSLSAPAFAQFAKAEDAIKYRQAAFTVLSSHFGRLGAMAQGKAPFDAASAAADAEVVAAVAKLPWHAFGPGTDTGSSTGARPEIWKEQAKFKDLGDKMQAETVKLAAAAKTGNLDNLKAAFGPAAQSCKACHDDFRRRR
ncbi:cytochrome c [Ottowia caeni]|uniref:c-type cytochrome n=1 Tax=Ottowia caeni TaxID=2870339 RepID=UPI001E3F4148|nr:cytochrome c [Ottowia caeni]